MEQKPIEEFVAIERRLSKLNRLYSTLSRLHETVFHYARKPVTLEGLARAVREALDSRT